MNWNNGKTLLALGAGHFLFGVSSWAFGKQFIGFMHNAFFKVSDGLMEFPLLNGTMDYESFAAFWFVYFGLLLIVLGTAVNYIENSVSQLPPSFVWTYFVMVLVGAVMIPFSGMTLLMLPHALYMITQEIKRSNQAAA